MKQKITFLIFSMILLLVVVDTIQAQPSFPEEPAQAPVFFSVFFIALGGMTGVWILCKDKN